MKKVKFLFGTMMFAALTFGFNACSNTNDEPNPPDTDKNDGSKEKPYDVTDILGFYDTNKLPADTVWVTGYIVGGVKTNVSGGITPDNPAGSTVQSADDVVFGTVDIRSTAVLIATSPDETDYLKCVAVKLNDPQTNPADFRGKVNLVDNPTNLKKALIVRGKIYRYFGLPGVRDITNYEFNGGGGTNPENDPNPVASLTEDFEGFTEGTGAAYMGTQTDNKGWFGYATQGTLQPDVRAYDNNKYVQFSAHRSNITNATTQEMWLVSPRLDVSAASSKILSFEIAAGYFNANTTFKVYVFKGDGHDPATADKTELTGFTLPTVADVPTTSPYTAFIPSGTINLSAYSGTIRIAFYYSGTSGSGNSTTYQLDNFAFGTSMTTLGVSSSSLSFVKEGETKSFDVTSNTTWTAISSDPANFSVATSGNTVNVTAAANTGSARTATVTVKTDNGAATKVVTLAQAGTVSGTEVFVETFANVAGTPWTAGTTELTDFSSFDNAGWTGSKVYPTGGVIKLGTASILGYVTTPSIDLSANGGNFTLVFKALVWYNDTKKIKVSVNGTSYDTVEIGQYNTASPTPPQEVVMNLSGGTANTQIKFEGYQAANGRFYLDEVRILQ